jgi:hypothetical protein
MATSADITSGTLGPFFAALAGKTTQFALDIISRENIVNILENVKSKINQLTCQDETTSVLFNISNDVLLKELLCRSATTSSKKFTQVEVNLISTIVNANLDDSGKPYCVSMPQQLMTEKQQHLATALMTGTLGSASINIISSSVAEKYKTLKFYRDKFNAYDTPADDPFENIANKLIKPAIGGSAAVMTLVTGIYAYKKFISKVSLSHKKDFMTIFTRIAETKRDQDELFDIIQEHKRNLKNFREDLVNIELEKKRLKIMQELRKNKKVEIVVSRGSLHRLKLNHTRQNIFLWEKMYKPIYKEMIKLELLAHESDGKDYGPDHDKVLIELESANSKQIAYNVLEKELKEYELMVNEFVGILKRDDTTLEMSPSDLVDFTETLKSFASSINTVTNLEDFNKLKETIKNDRVVKTKRIVASSAHELGKFSTAAVDLSQGVFMMCENEFSEACKLLKTAKETQTGKQISEKLSSAKKMTSEGLSSAKKITSEKLSSAKKGLSSVRARLTQKMPTIYEKLEDTTGGFTNKKRKKHRTTKRKKIIKNNK